MGARLGAPNGEAPGEWCSSYSMHEKADTDKADRHLNTDKINHQKTSLSSDSYRVQ